jgi:hypothetical protein
MNKRKKKFSFALKIFSLPAIVDVAGLRGKRFGVTRSGLIERLDR